jgi:hypothetical protein
VGLQPHGNAPSENPALAAVSTGTRFFWYAAPDEHFYSTMNRGGNDAFAIPNRFSAEGSLSGRSHRRIASRQIKWDSVPLNFRRKSLKTNESPTDQVGHFFDPA